LRLLGAQFKYPASENWHPEVESQVTGTHKIAKTQQELNNDFVLWWLIPD